MDYKKNIHIGSLIKEKVKERGICIKDFAKAIHCNRGNVYSIFGRKSIDIDQLLLISKILEHDFIAEYHKIEDDITKIALVLLEIPESKFHDLKSDSSVKIINHWRVSK